MKIGKKNKAQPQEEELTLPSGTPADFVRTPAEGLSEAEAAERAARGDSNAVTADPGKSVWRILADNLFTLFNLLNVALAAALASVHAWSDMAFLGVVLGNTACATHQELKAKHAVNKLKLLSESPVRVRREGKEKQVPSGLCVKGDLVILRAGDQVPADAILREGHCTVSEALLTGEQDAVPKGDGDWLYSGSYLTSGICTVQLVFVGDSSYASRLSVAAKKIIPPKSALMGDMTRVVRTVSMVLLPIGALLFSKRYFLSHAPIRDSVRETVAAMVGMIPEGLMLLTSLALTVGVIRLARRRTLVQQIYSIENLARVDMLCLDKTGTLTSGRMALAETSPAQAGPEELNAAMARFLGAMDLESPTLQALSAAVAPGEEKAEAVLSFSSERKKSAAGFADGTVLILGAPSFVLPEAMLAPLLPEIRRGSAEGLRVVVLAEAKGRIEHETLPPPERVLGLFMLTDELRPEAPETLRYFREEGVDIKVISGDDPVTVASIAVAAGLPDARERAVDVSRLTDEEVRDAATRYTVFGRVTPDRKLLLVEALQAAGHSVAMTGDGVNDIPAMKKADCSVAMASGSDAARHAAQVILLDSDFSCLPRVVAEGRRVINNITRSASLFLVKTMYSFALSLLTLLLPLQYPFVTIQLSLISTMMVGMPSFILTLEPNNERVQGNFLWNVLRRAIPGALAVTVCATTAAFLESRWPIEVCRTLATLADGAVGVCMLISVCYPLTKLRTALIAMVSIAFVIAVRVAGSFFALTPLQGEQLWTLGLMILGGAAVVAVTRLALERINLRRNLREALARKLRQG